MAYARWNRRCDWYIFWHSTKADDEREQSGDRKPKAEEMLAVWHADFRATAPLWSYAEVSAMVAIGDFSRIPGFTNADRELVARCLSEFVRDVDEEWALSSKTR